MYQITNIVGHIEMDGMVSIGDVPLEVQQMLASNTTWPLTVEKMVDDGEFYMIELNPAAFSLPSNTAPRLAISMAATRAPVSPEIQGDEEEMAATRIPEG